MTKKENKMYVSSSRLAIFSSEALGSTFWHATGKHNSHNILHTVSSK